MGFNSGFKGLTLKLLPNLQQFEKEKRQGYFQTICLYRKNFCLISVMEIFF